jgi:hypothetical protein
MLTQPSCDSWQFDVKENIKETQEQRHEPDEGLSAQPLHVSEVHN